ncbi:MAG TPA: hypothetical protein PL167_00885 [Cyclobacteriaceae bacterium]|nr:hypothetical protein [Cyclobacteriaceae bacterium]
MLRFINFVIVLLLVKVGNAQSISTQMGARAAGMGYASSGITDDWSLHNNVGAIGSLDKMSAAAAYEVRSQLQNANRMAFAFNAPIRWGVTSLGAFRFGDELYNEQILSAGFGNKFGIASLGLKANYIQYQASGFGTHSTFSVDFGGLAQLTDQLSVGAYITNLTQAKINTEYDSERLPTRLTAGLTFKPKENIFITTELDKDIDYAATWRTGFEYSFKEKFFIRTGFNLNPQAGFFGLGVRKKRIQADYSVQFNSVTGASHQASASYSFHRNEKK